MAVIDLFAQAQQLVKTPSDSGTSKLVTHLIPLVQGLGLGTTLQPPKVPTGFDEMNLIGHSVPAGDNLCPGGLALVTHLDTVPAGNRALWTETQGDPYRATIRGDKIFGLGSADTKLDFLCKLKALEKIGVKNLKIPVALIGSFGEERALAGARLLLETQCMTPRLALVGEPSELKPMLGHKGILYLRAVLGAPVGAYCNTPPQHKTFQGRAAHGAMPHLGKNAIYEAIDWLRQERGKNPQLQLLHIHGGTVHNIVPEQCEVSVATGNAPCPKIDFLVTFLELIRASEKFLAQEQAGQFDPPITTCNVGVIRDTQIEFDYRLIPPTDQNKLLHHWEQLTKTHPDARVELIRSNPPMNTLPSSEIARRTTQALGDIGLPANFGFKSGNTEGAIFNQMGAESIVIGPGISMGNIHQPNEFNNLSQLSKAVEFYTAFLRAFC